MNLARSTAYYRSCQRNVTVDEILAQRIKHIIDEEPYVDYRMAWAQLRQDGVLVNRKTVQRIMQIKRWQCHRRLHKSCYPRVEFVPALLLDPTSAGRRTSRACGPNTTA